MPIYRIHDFYDYEVEADSEEHAKDIFNEYLMYQSRNNEIYGVKGRKLPVEYQCSDFNVEEVK